MKYSRFEDLPVWNHAIALKLGVDELCKHMSDGPLRNWVDQIDRAALSIGNNIAEGFERGTTSELLMFIYIARGSAGEVRSMLQYAMRRPGISNLKSQISELVNKSESISRQLRGWAQSLQDGDIKGQRFLTGESQRSYHRRKRADALWERSRAIHEASMHERLSQSSKQDQDTDQYAEATDNEHDPGSQI